MKTSIVYIISVLLLCVSCSLEIQPQFRYVVTTGNNGCYTVRVRMPENWKIVNAQLKPTRLTVEYDSGRGRGIDKWLHASSNKLFDTDDSVQFRGANRIDGLALLYFTKEEDPKGKFNPPIGTAKISSTLREQEAFAIFRTNNWLVIHFSIKKTGLGDLASHDLTKRYAKNQNIKGNPASFKTIDGKMHYNLVFNNREKRSFLIDEYYRQHDTYSDSLSHSKSNNELSWTWHFRIISNENKIISNQIMDK